MSAGARVAFVAALLAATVFGTPVFFAEREGLVAIEAEHFTDNAGAWEEVEGRNATATQRGTTSDGELRRRTAPHPFVAGLPDKVSLPPGTMLPWGFAGEQATVGWALSHDQRKAAVFGYERGARMPTGIAPARRVLVSALDSNSPDALGRIFDAALQWAAEGPGKRVLLTSNQQELVDEERLLVKRIEALGFNVKVRPAAETTAADAEGCAVVMIPPPVRVEKIGTKFNQLAVPVVTAKSHIAQFLGMVPPVRASRPGDNAMLIRGGKWDDHLRYAIHFATPGEYRVWLLGQSGGDAGTDEAKIFFDDVPDVRGPRFFEMKLPDELGWVSAATARMPENRKSPVPAIISVRQPGWHNLYVVKGAEPEHHGAESPLARHYPNWRVDKIVLARERTWTPRDDGPAETRATPDTPRLPPEFAARPEWRPRQVWPVRDGYVVLEAEDLDHHANWTFKTEPAGAAGRGYLEWRGPNRSKSVEDLGGNDDHLHVRQGPPEEWLILRFHVDKPGAYAVDLRNHHRLKDGDNDVWFARVGQRGTAEAPIRRLVDSHRDGAGFTWLDSTAAPIEFTAGVNELYIGGRSVGFGIDRIALYVANNSEAKTRAMAGATRAAQPGYVMHALWDFEPVVNGEWVPYYRDLRGDDAARHALAINAAEHKGKFAAARVTFAGTAGIYDVMLATLTENDGESTYRVRIAGQSLGEFQNPPRTDHSPASHTWRGVSLKPGYVIEVQSNTHSNGKIPEKGAFAWSRGRWTALLLMPAQE